MNAMLLAHASSAVQWHAALALAGLLLGCVQMMRPKGTHIHRWLGRAWVLAMLLVAVSSFWIRGLMPNTLAWGFSPIHLLSIFVIVQLARAIYFARIGTIARHSGIMKGVFWGGLVIAGGFTLIPGRLMFEVFLAPLFAA